MGFDKGRIIAMIGPILIYILHLFGYGNDVFLFSKIYHIDDASNDKLKKIEFQKVFIDAKSIDSIVPHQNREESTIPSFNIAEIKSRVYGSKAVCTSISLFVSLNNEKLKSVFVPGHALNEFYLNENTRIALDFYRKYFFINSKGEILDMDQLCSLIYSGEKPKIYNFYGDFYVDEKLTNIYFDDYKFKLGYYKLNKLNKLKKLDELDNLLADRENFFTKQLKGRVGNFIIKLYFAFNLYDYYGTLKDIMIIYLFRTALFFYLAFLFFYISKFFIKRLSC